MRTATLFLLLATLALPIAICVFLGAGRLLTVMGDLDGALFVNRVSLFLALVWVIAIIALLIVQAALVVTRPNTPEDLE